MEYYTILGAVNYWSTVYLVPVAVNYWSTTCIKKGAFATRPNRSIMEYRIFRDEYAILHEGIQPELHRLVSKCYSKYLIGSSTEEAATLITWTNDQKATSLLRAIDSRIKTDSNAFYDFLKILMSLPALHHLADTLKDRLPPTLRPAQEATSASHSQPQYDSQNPDGTLYYDAMNQRYVILKLKQITTRAPFTASTSMHVYNPPPNAPPDAFPDHVLDQKCEDIPLADIAIHLKNYETIHMYLNITDLEMQDIIQENQDPLRQRQLLLRKWKAKHGFLATYGKLIQCFEDAGRQDLVSVTHGVLQSRYPVTAVEAATPDVDGVAGRTALQTPQRAPSQDPPTQFTAFLKQHSQLQLSPDHKTDTQPPDHKTDTQPPDHETDTQPPDQEDFLSSRFQLRLGVQPHPEGEEVRLKRWSLDNPGVHSPTSTGSTHSSDSLQDSFKSAVSHLSKASTSEESDGSDEDLMRELDRITTKCKGKFSQKQQVVTDLRQKVSDKDKQLKAMQECYKEKEEALKQLEQCLADKEQQLAVAQLPYPQQETEVPLTELETELRLTKEFLEDMEKERDALLSELTDAKETLETCQKKKRSLERQLFETRVQLSKSQRESHDHKKENVVLKQQIQDLENRIDFFFENTKLCSRRRSQSV